ncbi:putative membrane protein [Caulobacter rhizosphaerae]|uniref:Membrane protein n=1 Tax=Caulobacter rhizosphaerae TaxID=2010972 RepID=A0ABU1N3K8_9CAUL|nr:DUF2339 domain-containing protein [Caulobacter rhizosphaerae]MDR6533033.1 putative membrane protein [Caulobacter rhizosphaerae]
MTWLIIVALGVWALYLNRRLDKLEAKVRILSSAPPTVAPRRSDQAAPQVQAAPAAASPKPSEPTLTAQDSADAARPMTIPTMATGPDAPLAPARRQPPPLASQLRPSVTWAQASTWLAENGLAWLGGGGLALGGLLLVVYAAQRGVFTPPFRIAAAVVMGFLMIAASEWIRRQTRAPGGRHALAAATAAGAGAVTLYGAIWAAHVLYQLIPLPLAAVLITAVSGGLLALALLHGEALALLALLGAFLAPAITRQGAWPPLALQGYLMLLGATGPAVAALRRWGPTGLATLAGLAFWSLAALARGREADLALLLAVALAGPALATLRPDPRPAAAGTDLFQRLPLIALLAVSLGALGLWRLGDADAAPILAALLILAAATLAAFGRAPAWAFAAPAASAILGLLSAHRLGVWHPTTPNGAWPIFAEVFGLTVVIAGAGLAAALSRSAAVQVRTTLLAIAAIGAMALANLAWPLLDGLPGRFDDHAAALASGLAAALLAAGAVLLARRVEDPKQDVGLGLWIAAAAELLFLTVHGLTPHHAEPAAMALAALALAAVANRRPWRGLAATAVAGAVVTLATTLRPSFVLDAASGALSLPRLALVTAVAFIALAAAGRTVGAARRDHRTEAKALSTAALLTLLAGLFLILHAVLARWTPPSAGAEPLLEASLRTALVLSAGLLLARRGRTDDGPIARWRLIVVVTLGASYGLLAGGLFLHPWWGEGRMAAGLPLLNDLLLTFLAPALLLAATAHFRPDPADRWSRGWFAAAAVFALLWAVTVVRHAFHGAAMDIAAIGRAEACAYAVIALLTARAFRLDRLRASRAAWLHAAAPAAGWTALAVALLVFGWLASPWWGPSETPMASAAHVALVLALYAGGAGAALSLRRGHGALDRAALCASVGALFALVTLLTRFAFHGADMRQGLDRGGLETWTFSAIWTVFGLIVLFRASARKDAALRWLGLVVLLATAAKVLLFDMATLDGVVRAASFLAVGALFIAGAMVARRLNAGHKIKADDSPTAQPDDRSPAP